jgi:hypothetical protein
MTTKARTTQPPTPAANLERSRYAYYRDTLRPLIHPPPSSRGGPR